ncbi:hypothetical protein CC78DRAFT_576219 [Lojkania enalia]|uniref:Uncharacterized protein n=1 Tax=Lojkania enalia TaxID=147567 RepID=A0A9P4N703_9PLEO|nr:hypothetical protein CC78DRAFT_576219 [Didymosphaeria enalia]
MVPPWTAAPAPLGPAFFAAHSEPALPAPFVPEFTPRRLHGRRSRRPRTSRTTPQVRMHQFLHMATGSVQGAARAVVRTPVAPSNTYSSNSVAFVPSPYIRPLHHRAHRNTSLCLAELFLSLFT